MSDEEALLAAIWEHPHEDTPRLVYADWLQENGQPERAEFTRVQCELARLDEWDEETRPALETREQALWRKFAKGWKADLPKPLQQAGFRRGFPDPRRREVRVNAFLKMSAAELTAAPLWSFSMPPATNSLDKLLACPHLLRAGTLLLSDWIGGERMQRRFPSKKGETRTPAERFAASPNARNLEALDLHWSSDLGDDGLAALVVGNLPHLRRLAVQNCGITDKGVKALVASPLAVRLARLDLYANDRVRSDGLAALFGPAALPQLTDLKLPATIGVAGLHTIAKSAPAFRLRKLSIYLEEKADVGAFLAWSGLDSVRDLDLVNSRIDARIADVLRAPRLAGLRVLRADLSSYFRADTAALDALADDPALLPKLTELRLQFGAHFLMPPTVEKLRARLGTGLILG